VVHSVTAAGGIPAAAGVEGASFTPSCDELLDLLLEVSDGRSPQGRDHPAAVVLALTAAATVAGSRGYTAIAGWVADVPAEIISSLYRRAGTRPPVTGRPSRSTIWRVCTDADPAVLDTAISTWSAARHHHTSTPTEPDQPPGTLIRIDGKTVRGAVDPDGHQLHLVSALAGPALSGATSIVLAQTEVDGAKTSEPAYAHQLLRTLDLTATTVTADALHTSKATAELIRTRGGHFVLPVKGNRPAVYAALAALPWTDTPITHETTETAHGRTTRRTIRVLPPPPTLNHPHVNQVWLIERHVTRTKTGQHTTVSQLGIASHTPQQATPADLAAYNRGHWAIETLHHIRDTCYREDHSRVRTRNGPRILASLRNLAINALRLAGRPDITEATRWAARNMTRPFTILSLTT
jgi:predicted transposase YbfD/YdcC